MRIPAEMDETLRRWGIHTCAEFAALPEVAVVERLGQEGRRWQLLAQGADAQPLIVAEFPLRFEECMEQESPVELLEPLLFILNRLLEQLCARLRMHILAASEIKVTLAMQRNDSRGGEPLEHVRTLRLPEPAKEAKFLLRLVRLDLEMHPPASPVVAVRITASPTAARSRQLGLFLPLNPSPERLEITLARIQKIVGEKKVGSAVLVDTHRPNAFQQNRFVLPETWANHSDDAPAATSAMRMYRPPLPANVEFAEGKPVQLACEGVRLEILACAGPWRTKGDWWLETAWAREEWDVEVLLSQPREQLELGSGAEEETGLYRIYNDRLLDLWFVEGAYD